MLERKEKCNTRKRSKKTRRKQSEANGKIRKTKKISDRIKQYRQNRTFQNNNKKFNK